jgi:fatty-acyl-CoA synthase
MIGTQIGLNAARRPDATALVFGERRYSYAALDERACKLANAMTAVGIRSNDRVAALMNNCSEFIELLMAAAKLGAIFVPINFRLAAREVGQVLENCQPHMLFAGESLSATISALDRHAGLPSQIVWVADHAAGGENRAEHPFERWLDGHAADEPDRAVTTDDIQFLLHTSGTTGRPKAAVWTHGTTLASSLAKIIDFGLDENDATVVFGPLFHAGPLLDLALPVLMRGGKLVVGPTTGFDPRRLLQTIADERATVVTIYPTMWRRVLALPHDDGLDLSHLRLLLTGGEAIPVPIMRGIYERFPEAGFVNTYGSTEGGPITTLLAPPDSARKIGSVGRPAFTVDVRIADQHGLPLGSGETGELLVRSPFVCKGYWRQPDETAAQLHNGWWHTGDLALRDDEGFIWIAGRKKDMIISGAENIYPIEIEQVIAELDGVIEVAVIGVPDERWGEAVIAYVVKAPGAALDEVRVAEHCRRQLAGYKKPREVIFVESLPRTTVTKIAKDVLRAAHAATSSG